MLDDRIQALLAYHKKEYGCLPSLAASAPGKINLLGDFTEYAQGWSLSFTLSQRLFVGLSPRNDNQIRFASREQNERKKTQPTNLKFRKEDRWANIPKGALAHLDPPWPESQGLDLSVVSELPAGVGLASSQALALASVEAAAAFVGQHLSAEERIDAAWKVETQFLSHLQSRGDFRTIERAAPGRWQLLDHRTGQAQFLTPDLEGLTVTLINPRLPVSSLESPQPQDEYDQDQVVRYLLGGRNGKTLRDVSRDDLRDRLGEVPESARRRSLHVVEENQRVLESLHVIDHRDWVSLGKLLLRSHESLRDWYEVSCPEVDWLVRRVTELPGVYGARLATKGRGGLVVILAETGSLDNLRGTLEEYERIFGFHAEVLPTSPDFGVQLHRV